LRFELRTMDFLMPHIYIARHDGHARLAWCKAIVEINQGGLRAFFKVWSSPVDLHRCEGIASTSVSKISTKNTIPSQTHVQYSSMPAIQRHPQRRYQVDTVGPDISHMAIILGCLGVVLMFVCAIAIYVRLRPTSPRTLPTEAASIEGRHTNESSDLQSSPVNIDQGAGQITVQEPGDLPKYEATLPTYRQNDLPPAYESTEVWSSSNAQASRPRSNWTSIWPLRSTQSG
jgi:hypothetical protein